VGRPCGFAGCGTRSPAVLSRRSQKRVAVELALFAGLLDGEFEVDHHAEWRPGMAVQVMSDLGPFVKDVSLPRLTLVRRLGVSAPLGDVEARARREVQRVLSAAQRRPGPVAVTAGSRGIANLVSIVRGVVAELRRAGWSPFVVPAMGSHGGGTERGQIAVLEELGVTEQAVGAPVRSTLTVEDVGLVRGSHLFIDRFAAQAGAVFVVNRVKAHTDFHGEIESGPSKMLAIGLGHVPSALELHAGGPAGLQVGVPEAAKVLVAKGIVVGAIATVENEIGQTALVQGLLPEEIGEEPEMRLLTLAKAMMPRLPFSELDALVVQRLGKDISGEGVDPNVIGRMYITGVSEPESPSITCIAALSLTEASSGNALGIGLTDFISGRLAQAIDFKAMYANALTAGIVDVRRAKLPIVLPTDRLAIQAALASCGRRDLSNARVMWIEDTEHLEIVGVSEPLARDARRREDLSTAGEGCEMRFDSQGSLLPLGRS
jgi:hypothetical protein